MNRVPDTTGDGGITLDGMFRCLSDPTRRRILARLADSESPEDAEVRILDIDPGTGPPGQFRLKLYHRDLPLLQEANLVDWDPDAGTIAPGENFPEVQPLISLLLANRDRLPGDWL